MHMSGEEGRRVKADGGRRERSAAAVPPSLPRDRPARCSGLLWQVIPGFYSRNPG